MNARLRTVPVELVRRWILETAPVGTQVEASADSDETRSRLGDPTFAVVMSLQINGQRYARVFRWEPDIPEKLLRDRARRLGEYAFEAVMRTRNNGREKFTMRAVLPEVSQP